MFFVFSFVKFFIIFAFVNNPLYSTTIPTFMIHSVSSICFTGLPAAVRRLVRVAVACVLTLTALSLASCHSSRKITTRPGHPEVEEIHVGRGDRTQRKIIEEAYTWLGTPYKYAAQNKGTGTDCSGMVMMVYEAAAGEKLPRNSAKQAEFCTPVDASEVDMGDLVFFATGKDPKRVSHVGIVVDSESFIHASSSKGVVVSKFANNYYKRTFLMFGRVPHRKDLVSERTDGR